MLASLRTKFLLPTFLRFFRVLSKKRKKSCFLKSEKKRKIRILEHCTWVSKYELLIQYSVFIENMTNAHTNATENWENTDRIIQQPCYRREDRAMPLYISIRVEFYNGIVRFLCHSTQFLLPKRHGRTNGQTDDMQSHNRALRSIER